MIAILIIIIVVLLASLLSWIEHLQTKLADAKRDAERPTWQRLTSAEREWLGQMPLTAHEKEMIQREEGDPERDWLVWRWNDRFGPDEQRDHSLD